MSEFFVYTNTIPLKKWREIVDRAVAKAKSFEIQVYLDDKFPELPGLPTYGDSLFGHRPDIRREVDGNNVTLSAELNSAAGEDFLKHIKADLPGTRNALFSYDFLDVGGEAVLSIQDLSDLIWKTDREMTIAELAIELGLPEEDILFIS